MATTNMSSLMVTGILLVITYRLFQYFSLRYKRNKNGCSTLPRYPHKDPIFGIDLFLRTAKALKSNNWLPELDQFYARNGSTFTTTKFGSETIFTIDPENVKSILTADASSWGVQPIRLSAMEPFCGRGFLTVDGSLWHQSRRMFSHSFEKSAISDFSALEKFTQKMLDKIPSTKGQEIDMQPLVSSLFIDATTLFLFGESFGALSPENSSNTTKPTTTEDVSNAFEQAMFGSGMRIGLGPLAFLARTKKWLKACQDTRSFAELYVNRALERQNPSKRILLENLAQQTRDNDHLRNEVLQAFFVSQGTTSILVSNVLFLVARRSGLWTQMRQEILDSAIGPEQAPTYDELLQLALPRRVVNEALRLHAVLPSTARAALKDTTLPTGGGPKGTLPVFIPKGTKINITFSSMQTSTHLWGEDAKQFKPERWIDFDPSVTQPYTFLPFGAGPRQCLGRDKAIVEALYVLVRLLQRFERIESRDDTEWRGQVALSARNVHGCQVAFY